MKKIFPVILAIIFASSCAKVGLFSSGKKNLRAEIDQVNDSVQVAWTNMITTDDRKIADTRRLIQEISYTENHDEIRVKEMLNRADQLKLKRYQQNTMTSDQIDAYDAATDSLLRATFLLIEETPEMEKHSLTSSLEEDIKAADSQVIWQRVKYDNWAKKFNAILIEKDKKVSKLGDSYSSLQPLPLFELPAQ